MVHADGIHTPVQTFPTIDDTHVCTKATILEIRQTGHDMQVATGITDAWGSLGGCTRSHRAEAYHATVH